MSTLGWSTQTASLPLVVDLPHGPKLGVLQADLDDYPAMYLASRPSQPRMLSAFFPRRVVKEEPGGYMNFLLMVAERADDIAETEGTRAFPWRAFVLARRDADLVASDMVTRLAPPPAAGSDFSWVKPGKVVWDYWADWNLEGGRLRGGPKHEDLQVLRRFRRQARPALRQHRLAVVGPARSHVAQPGDRCP